MHLTLTSIDKHDIEPLLRAYVEEKVALFEKYITQGSDSGHVAVQLGKAHHSERNADDLYYAEIHVMAAGIDQYVSSKDATQQGAFDKAREEMATVLRREKDKKVSLVRRSRNLMRKMLRFGK